MSTNRRALILTLALFAIAITPTHGEVITKLQIRLRTADQRGAGTGDRVYFGIGGLTWPLSDERAFRRNGESMIELPLPVGVHLTTDDIAWLRLEKKGWFALRHMPDGFAGRWLPASVALIVNGREFRSAEIHEWLSRAHPTWVLEADLSSPLVRATKLLSMIPQKKLTRFPRLIAFLTTPFKRRGISGWIDVGLGATCVTGTVFRPPARSTDGFVTIDLNAEQVCVAHQMCSAIEPLRYIRVEHLNLRSAPRWNQRVTYCGSAWWDTDAGGWLEIHAGRIMSTSLP